MQPSSRPVRKRHRDSGPRATEPRPLWDPMRPSGSRQVTDQVEFLSAGQGISIGATRFLRTEISLYRHNGCEDALSHGQHSRKLGLWSIGMAALNSMNSI